MNSLSLVLTYHAAAAASLRGMDPGGKDKKWFRNFKWRFRWIDNAEKIQGDAAATAGTIDPRLWGWVSLATKWENVIFEKECESGRTCVRNYASY